MEETPAIRLKLFIDTSGLTTTQFADMCGIPRPSLSQILSGRNKKISDILIGQIHRAFPDLSVVWLLFGEGPVRISSSNSAASAQSQLSTTSSSAVTAPGGNSISDTSLFADAGQTLFTDGDSGIAEYGMSQTPRNGENRPVAQNINENANLSELRNVNFQSNSRENQLFESDLKIMDLQRQIEQMRQNPRKVVQITIYYDDSTFETFTPK